MFDKRANKVGKCSNYKFSVKSIRNYLCLYNAKQGSVDFKSKKNQELYRLDGISHKGKLEPVDSFSRRGRTTDNQQQQ